MSNVPEWLSKHDADLRPGMNGKKWLVLFGGSPRYNLTVVPAKGQFECAVTQTVNGKRLDTGKIGADVESALQLGLEDLRTHLGW
jgi:hypothetical protein